MSPKAKDLKRKSMSTSEESLPRRETRNSAKRLKLKSGESRAVSTIPAVDIASKKLDGGTEISQVQEDNGLTFLAEAVETMEQVSRPSDSPPAESVLPEGETEIRDDKETSRPTSHPMEQMESRQHGSSDPTPALTVSFSPSDNRSTQDGIVGRPDVVAPRSGKPGDTLEKVLASSNMELRRTIGQYEQHMVLQEEKNRDLQTKLDQAQNHAKVLKQKEEEIQMELVNRSNEHKVQMLKHRKEADDQIAALEKQRDDALSQSEKTRAMMSSEIERLTSSEHDLAKQLSEHQVQMTKRRKETDDQIAELKKKLSDARSSAAKRLAQKEKSLNEENSMLKAQVSSKELEVRDLYKRLGHSHSTANACRQELEDAKYSQQRTMNIMGANLEDAVRQQLAFSEENQQLRRVNHGMNQTISNLNARLGKIEQQLQEAEEELLQMRMNRAMEIGFQMG